MKKAVIISGVVIVILAALVALLLFVPKQGSVSEVDSTTPTRTAPAEQPRSNDVSVLGRYKPYEEIDLQAEGYDQSILFFHAAWCPECRAFESAIQSQVIPEGVQILKVDYDSATELRQRYQITLQSTFVSVDSEGNAISTWVGYGKDKSVESILGNL